MTTPPNAARNTREITLNIQRKFQKTQEGITYADLH